jgi:hypothetical protein
MIFLIKGIYNMEIGNLQVNKTDEGKIITGSGNTVSEEQVEATTFRVKKNKVEALASKLNTPVPGVTPNTVDEVLKELSSEADRLSIKEKDQRGIRAEDTRSGYDSDLFFLGALTGDKGLVSQMLNAEGQEDQEDLEKLKTMQKAESKNITVYENLIRSSDSADIDRLDNSVKLAEDLEAKGLNINVDQKSDIAIKTNLDTVDNQDPKNTDYEKNNTSEFEIADNVESQARPEINKSLNSLGKT